MCERLDELRDALAAYAAGFDAAVLSGEDAGQVVVEAAALERLAGTVKGLAAARAADAGVWKAAGERSAAHHLARTAWVVAPPSHVRRESARIAAVTLEDVFESFNDLDHSAAKRISGRTG